MTDIVEVARFATLHEAEFAAAFLADRGIAARLADRGMASLNPDMLIALGDVRVVVPSDRLAVAQELLAEVRAGLHRRDSDDWKAEPAADIQSGGLLGPIKRWGSVLALLALVTSCLVLGGR